MKHFTKVVPRDINNIYWEFERFFSLSILYAESRCYDMGINEYPNNNYIRFLKENNVFDSYYALIINEIKIHLISQFETIDRMKLITFTQHQNIYIKDFDPFKRKKTLFHDYLVLNIAHGEESILGSGYRLNKYEKSIASLAFNNYVSAYYSLANDIGSMISYYVNNLHTWPVIQPIFPISIIDKPKPKYKGSQPSGGVKVLFFYYLHLSKDIDFPVKANFETLMNQFHFTGSWFYVYKLFRRFHKGNSEILNKDNLKKVMKLLQFHKTAYQLADNDLYQILTETNAKLED
jgi:hypothetical protein